jgi:hypothetical protein
MICNVNIALCSTVARLSYLKGDWFRELKLNRKGKCENHHADCLVRSASLNNNILNAVKNRKNARYTRYTRGKNARNALKSMVNGV